MNKKVEAHIYITSKCNLKCKHCSQNLSNIDFEKEVVLSKEQIQQLCSYFVRNFDVDIDMEGGEIFLREDIGELFSSMDGNIKRVITLTTNGTFPWIKEYSALAGVDRLRFSVEGHIDSLQEELRGIKLEPVISNLQSYQAHGIPTSLRVTLYRDNYPYLPAMIDSMSGWGVKLIEFHEYRSIGRGKKNSDRYSLSHRDIERTLELLQDNPIHRENVETRINFTNSVINQSGYKEKILKSGYQIHTPDYDYRIAIGPDGSIYPCSWQYGNVIGNINVDELTEIMKNNEYLKNHYTYCDKCTATQIISKPRRD